MPSVGTLRTIGDAAIAFACDYELTLTTPSAT
jgi:hypothetical protein